MWTAGAVGVRQTAEAAVSAIPIFSTQCSVPHLNARTTIQRTFDVFTQMDLLFANVATLFSSQTGYRHDSP